MDAFDGKQFIILLYVVLRRHYPDFEQLLNAVPDHRKRRTYQVAEILSAGLLMFVLRRGSRNQTDQLSGNQFECNYLKIFGFRLPIMDTVHQFLEKLPAAELEKLRELLVRRLMERKVFEKWKFQGHYNLSFDATGIHAFDEEPFEGCPYKETKNSIKWYAGILEAKLVFANGFSISLASEPLANQNGKFDKQDCEQVAFKRLAAKVKAAFPRLAILVSADGLYCSGPVFDTIAQYGWKFAFTFKDESLKTLWKEIGQRSPTTIEQVVKKLPNGLWLKENTSFVGQLTYKGQEGLGYVEHQLYTDVDQPLERHVHLTNIAITTQNARQISRQGRMRWKIENEGFNTQKNQGFSLGHKYARKNFNAMKNYYLLVQIAHLITQLVEKLKGFQSSLEGSGRTVKAIVEKAIALLGKQTISIKVVLQHYHQHKQLRY